MDPHAIPVLFSILVGAIAYAFSRAIARAQARERMRTPSTASAKRVAREQRIAMLCRSSCTSDHD